MARFLSSSSLSLLTSSAAFLAASICFFMFSMAASS